MASLSSIARTALGCDTDLTLTFKPRLRVLSEEQVEEIHLASLEILERIGIALAHTEAVELLYGSGADIGDDGRIRIPAWLVEEAIRKAPPRVALADRSGKRRFFLEGRKSVFGSGLDCPDYLQPLSGQRRRFNLDDGRVTALVSDALPHISFVETGGMAADVDPQVADRAMARQALTYCEKPLVFECKDARSVADIWEMASVIRGSENALRLAPNVVHYSEPISPLWYGDEAVGKLLSCAERGIPLIFIPAPMAGATAPVTLAGMIAQANAESLAGLVVAQLKSPGTSFIYGGLATIMDMSTTVFSYGAPEMSLAVAALAEMAHFYRLPIFGTAGCSDSKAVDLQAAVEVAVSCLVSATLGAHLVHDVGMMDQCTLVSPELMVLTNEILGMLEAFMSGIPVSAETLALDVVEKVQPGGSFLAEDHTLRHFKQIWYPEIFDRTTLAGWERMGGYLQIKERLRKRTRQIIEKHQPQPLSPDVVKELDRMAARWA